MAKAEMMCPFSGKQCKECALYRGRHYYLCFCKQYRGYIKQSGSAELTRKDSTISRADPSKQFEVPPLKNTGVLDPFALPQKDINE